MHPLPILTRALSLPTLFAVAALTACGSPDAPPTPTAETSEALTELSTGCPTDAPANGSSCTTASLECSWGTDPRFGCRTGGTCSSALKWEIWEYACPEPAPKCPATAPTSGSKCSLAREGITCVYSSSAGTTAYTCDNCDGNLCEADNLWYATDLASGCPDAVPNWGASCSSPGLTCNYDWCAGELVCGVDGCQYTPWVDGTQVVCQDGAWTPGGSGECP
jgi:hypothetical protein